MNAAIESETLRATLDAYAAGKIDLGKVPAKTRASYILDAPHVTPQTKQSGSHPYTKMLLAKFLGWTIKKGTEPDFAFETAFRALQLIEDGIVKEKHLAGKKREEDAKHWTQARVAAALGVAQNTVSVWFTSNINTDKACKPDARVVLSPDAKAKIDQYIDATHTHARGETFVHNCGRFAKLAATGWPLTSANESSRLPTPGGNERWQV